jgi:hypothetical protein
MALARPDARARRNARAGAPDGSIPERTGICAHVVYVHLLPTGAVVEVRDPQRADGAHRSEQHAAHDCRCTAGPISALLGAMTQHEREVTDDALLAEIRARRT